MRRLAHEHYPQAKKIRVVLDNLSTHMATAFYESFSAEVARKLARRIELVYTPVHGSWPNMVEVEVSVLVRQCLKRRLADIRDELAYRIITALTRAVCRSSKPLGTDGMCCLLALNFHYYSRW
jgi:hypothetical protein